MTETSTMGFIWDAERIVEDLLRKSDETVMPLPAIDSEPHLLISKIRKHYFDYVVKLLSHNYENYQMLLNKNIHLPSAIWRCAKMIETNAARASMVAELYRKNIMTAIKELKNYNKRGKLHKGLFECLQRQDTEKKTQTTLEISKTCTCQCTCNGRKKKKRSSVSPQNNGLCNKVPHVPDSTSTSQSSNLTNKATTTNITRELYKIPTVLNSLAESPQVITLMKEKSLDTNMPIAEPNKLNEDIRMSVDSQDSSEDQIMLQLEQLFKGNSNDDDLFDNVLDTPNCELRDRRDSITETQDNNKQDMPNTSNSVIVEQADKIKSLDERLALLESAGLLAVNQPSKEEIPPKPNKSSETKWLCEMYFRKVKLFETLDEIRDSNRVKHARIKRKFLDLFGEDSDDEQILSPLNETPEFILSCKERMAPWIVKILTPYYVKGRIRGKPLFKAVAKHLIKLIYQCSRYPSEYEVHSFVTDFLKTHPIIRCEADFKQFKINNI